MPARSELNWLFERGPDSFAPVVYDLFKSAASTDFCLVLCPRPGRGKVVARRRMASSVQHLENRLSARQEGKCC